MGFSDQSFAERYKDLGDKAESIYEVWARQRGTRVYRFGQERPPLKRHYKMPHHVTMRPDFQCEDKTGSDYFVEVKGCMLKRAKGYAYDETVKLKHVTIDALKDWREQARVFIFIYDSGRFQCCLISLENVLEKCESAPTEYFKNDGKAYYALQEDDFDWNPISSETITKAELLLEKRKELHKQLKAFEKTLGLGDTND